MKVIALHLLAMRKNLHVNEDINRARHLIKKSASELQVSEEEIIGIIKEEPITLFNIPEFPL